MMTFSNVVTELLALAASHRPSGAEIHAAFAQRASKVETGSSSLTHPSWTTSTRGPSDIFLTLSGDLEGLAIWEDSRGWGAYAELSIANGALSDLEAIVGKTNPVPRRPDDFVSGPKLAAYVHRNGRAVRVFAELDKEDSAKVRRLTLHFET